MSARRCASCGRFVSKHHLRTARYHYDPKAVSRTDGLSVYSLATATVFQERLDCAQCSMDCCRMEQAARGYGHVIGFALPNGWARCTPDSVPGAITYLTARQVAL